MQGIVIKSTGSNYTVRTTQGAIIDCKVKGNFRLKGIRSTNPVAVGDRVTITDEAGQWAYITAIEPRHNYMVRKASNLSKQSHILAANVDLVLLLATPSLPQTSTTFIDRVLASAEAYNIAVEIVFNKADIYTPADAACVQEWVLLYTSIGYRCHVVSCHTEQGLPALRQAIAQQVTLLAGHSGVGKSTLLNKLVPQAHVRTNTISSAHGTGMHTTTFSEWFDLPQGGAVIDVPGIKGFGTFDFERAQVSHYFVDLFALSTGCRFANCTHTHEPGCAVLAALEEHRLAPSRYQSYLSMLQDKDETKYREGY